MRNLKRVLALALAVVMMIGMMVTASAATYADKAEINADYVGAVNVTSDMGLFRGQGNGFAPKATLTRAEAAAIIYRVMTQDVTDSKVSLYDYASLKDIEAGKWYTGYVTYANNGGYVKGDGTNFYPLQTVTGTQFLAMALRAMGYGQKGEFEGPAWKDMVLTKATDLGLVKNIANVASLDLPASRELVAQLLFDALQAATTYYTPALGYIPTGSSLGAKFGLTKADYADAWGRPGVKYEFTTGTKSSIVMYTPKAVYTNAVTECQIAQDVKLTKATEYTLFTNGKVNATKYTVQPTDLVQRIGATGTRVEVYRDDIVVIDTFLAEVDDVTPVTYDPAGHKKADATITLEVYTYDNVYETVTKTSTTNFPYAKGDYVLVSAYTNNAAPDAYGSVAVVRHATNLTVKTTVAGVADYLEIQGKATALVGAQTVIWHNALQHTVNGTTYNDSKWFELDQATTEISNHTWYFDAYGNLIGAADIATQYTYGIIENIQWINPVGTAGYAQATIRYMDGTTETKTVASVDGTTLKYAQDAATASWANGISTDISRNFDLFAEDLYRIAANPNGTIALTHVANKAATPANTEITGATIKNTLAYIIGSANTASTYIYTNSATKFLVRTDVKANVGGTMKTVNHTFEVVTGYENMKDYTGTATVDYVDLNADGYAEYVYVTGASDSATAQGLFYLTSNNVQAVLNAKKDGIDHYLVTGIADGVAGTYKVDTSVITALVPSVTAGNTTSYVNDMFLVAYTNGKITSVVGPLNTTAAGQDLSSVSKAYTGKTLVYVAATNNPAAVTYKENVLSVVNATYGQLSALGVTPTVGTWAEKLGTKELYVIFDQATQKVTAIYIADAGDSKVDSSVAGTTWVNAHPSEAGYEIDGVSKMYVANAATKSIGQMVTDWSAYGVVTITKAGVTNVALNSNTETVASAIAGGAVITFTDSTTAWTIVVAK